MPDSLINSLSRAPYFDDFNTVDANGRNAFTKNYHRILFQPSKAVQTRELNQLQSMLQNQIAQLGLSQISNKYGGQVLNGEASIQGSGVYYIDATLDNPLTSDALLNAEAIQFIETRKNIGTEAIPNMVVDLKAEILSISKLTDGKYRIWHKYSTEGDDDGVVEVQRTFKLHDLLFFPNDVLPDENSTPISVTSQDIAAVVENVDDEYTATQIEAYVNAADEYNVDSNPSGKGFGEAAWVALGRCSTTVDGVDASTRVTGNGFTIDVEEGVFFIKGCFVHTFKQEQYYIIPDEQERVDGFVSLIIDESVTTPEQDATLKDNATGAYNYSAPGADRYTIKLTLALNTADPEVLAQNAGIAPIFNPEVDTSIQFLNVLEILDSRAKLNAAGQSVSEIINADRARRTREESGNYSVTPFKIRISEYLNDGSNGGCYELKTILQNNPNGIKNDFAESPGGNSQILDIGGNLVDEVDDLESETGGYIRAFVEYLNEKLAISIDPAVAYVDGFRIEAGGTRTVVLDKARDAEHQRAVEDTTFSLNRGNYIDVLVDPTATDVTPLASIFNADEYGKYIRGISFRGTVTANEIYDPGALDQYQIPKSKPYVSEQEGMLKMRLFVYGDFNSADAGSLPPGFSYPYLESSIVGGNLITDQMIKNPKASKSLFAMPAPAIKTISKVRYVAERVFTSTAAVANVVTISPPASTRPFQSGINALDIVVYKDTNFVNTITAINNIEFSGADLVITFAEGIVDIGDTLMVLAPIVIEDDMTDEDLAIGIKSLETRGALATEGRITLQVNEKTKLCTLPDQDVKLDTLIINKEGVTSEILDYRVVYDGQGDNFYENPIIKIVSDLDPSTAIPGVVNVEATYQYFVHPSAAETDKHYFTANSYPSEIITFEDIPFFQGRPMTDYIDFRVKRDRSYDAETNTFVTTMLNRLPVKLTPNSTIAVSYVNYMGRTDILTLTSSGEYVISRGMPAMEPQPHVVEGAGSACMNLYNIYVKPYTYSAADANKEYIDNTRYTMKDIGRLEGRIRNLEYYSSLSLLEKEAGNKKILDLNSADGIERFKNGTMVDSFIGHTVGNPADADYACAVNTKKQTMGPSFKVYDNRLRFTGLVCPPANDPQLRASWIPVTTINPLPTAITRYIESGSTIDGYVLDDFGNPKTTNSSKTTGADWPGFCNGEVMMLWAGEREILYENLLASTTISVQPYSVTTWTGRLHLSPSSDEWVDTTRIPDHIVDLSPITNGFTTFANELVDMYGVQETLVSDVTTSAITASSSGSSTGTFTRRNPNPSVQHGDWIQTVQQSNNWSSQTTEFTNNQIFAQDFLTVEEGHTQHIDFGDRVANVNIIPWMRSRDISFKARGLKPNTKLYAFFDDVNVTQYCSMIPTDSSNSYTTYANTQLNTADSINGNPISVYSLAPQQSTSSDVELHTGETASDLPTTNSQGGTRGVLKSDANGEIIGYFTIPNNSQHRFQTGTRTFKLIDNEYNNDAESDAHAQAKYTANGLNQEKQSVVSSVRVPVIEPARTFRQETNVWSETRTSSSSSLQVINEFDPIAQTFTVRDKYPNGLFLSDIDIFLASKPNDGNVPITIYIVPTDNGIPTQTIVPGSEVTKLGKDIPASFITGRQIITDDGGASGYSGNYGEVDPTQTRIMTKPTRFTFDYPVYLKSGEEYAVIIFSTSPEYRVWTSVLSELDLNSNQIVTHNPSFGVMLKSLNKSTWTPDQYRNLTCRLHKAIFETNATYEVKFSTFLPNNNQAYPRLIDDWTSATGNDQGISAYDHTGFKILMKAQEFPYSRLALEAAHRTPTGSRIEAEGAHVIPAGGEVQLDSEIPGAGIGHFTVDARMTTFDRDTSPVLDLETGTVIFYSNLINDDLSGEGAELCEEDTDEGDEGTTFTSQGRTFERLKDFTVATNAGEYFPGYVGGGNALARYITKHVVLNNASEDLRVNVAVHRPSEDCDIAVYARRKTIADGTKNMSEIDWYRMTTYSVGGDTNVKSAPISSVPTDYYEMEFVLPNPDPNVTDPVVANASGLFTEFAIKIVFVTNNKAKVCKIKNFTAIASL